MSPPSQPPRLPMPRNDAGMRNPQRHGELHEAVARENLGIRIVAGESAIGRILGESWKWVWSD
jgi:hypothetical protein